MCKTKWNSVGQSGNPREPVQVKKCEKCEFSEFLLHIHNFSDLSPAFLFGKRYDLDKDILNIFCPEIGQDWKFGGQKCQKFKILAGKFFKISKILKIAPNRIEMILALKIAQTDPK